MIPAPGIHVGLPLIKKKHDLEVGLKYSNPNNSFSSNLFLDK